MRGKAQNILPACMLFAVAHVAPISAANEFILFPEVRLSHQAPQSSTNDMSGKVIAGVDPFYAHDSGKLRLLGEAVLYEQEQEVELLQAGWVDWTIYGRLEGTRGGGQNDYLALFPDFVRARNLGGVCYDFMRGQSLRLEISNVHLKDRTYRPIVMQWSARFP